MRMVHYYGGLAVLLAPALFGALVTGIVRTGGQTHTFLGLMTAIGCVALNTLFILFMIVTGRVLKAAMQARDLAPEFLADLNHFFAEKKAYPAALLAAVTAVTTAVLGYGQLVGVPRGVHLALGLATVVVHAFVIPVSLRVLSSNQRLLDRVARELDRMDAEEPGTPTPPEPEEWAYGRRTRWLVFALSAWMPYLYWGLVVWRGTFANVPTSFLAGTILVSAIGFVGAARGRAGRGT